MTGINARQKILIRISSALKVSARKQIFSIHAEGSIFRKEGGDSSTVFAEKFTGLMGYYVPCINMPEAAGKLAAVLQLHGFKNIICTVKEITTSLQDMSFSFTDDMHQADVAITGCECLVARTGSVVLSAAEASGRAIPVYAPAHIVIADQSQLYYDTSDAIQYMMGKYNGKLPSSVHFVAGPSRTGDIEKTLVTGVHGPKEVFVFLISS